MNPTGKSHYLLFKAAITGALGGLLFGFDTAVISGVTHSLQVQYALSEGQKGFTVAIALYGTVFGAIFSGMVGQKLLNSTTRPGGLKAAHSLIAGAVGIVFATNTVTGVWNLWDARQDPKGRTRREIHSVLMLASDAGVLLTAISGSNAKHSLANARTHRTIAISSIALSAVGTGMMWLWRN